MPTLPALDYLARPPKDVPAVCVLFGDEFFLRRLALKELQGLVLGDKDGEFSFSSFDGDKAAWRDVHDELTMLALFGGSRRLVVVENADEFVSEHRQTLEDWVAHPAGRNLLVLDVRTWPKTTRLYKAVDQGGLQVDCALPAAARLKKWLVQWCKQRHGASLQTEAADLVLELAGEELGLLDQELAKLAAYAGQDAAITAEMVQNLVGGWRTQTAWEMLDAALAGEAHIALRHLDRLLAAGEVPIAVLGPVGWALRQFAAAAALVQQAEAQKRKIRLPDALAQAGVKSFKIQAAEKQLRQLGRQRALKLYRWLLAADLDLKGRSALEPRIVLERLIVRLSKQAQLVA